MEEAYFGITEEVEWETFEFDTDFEPVARSRSNTWPVPQPDIEAEAKFFSEERSKFESTEYVRSNRSPQAGGASGSSRRKKTARQNPWGEASYAELISQAISSSANGRLTLAQIYDWMVENVPFFKDKSESKSSAGWKNSVRHNLSLHNRFMRLPNESQGKSSWWTINPDAKQEKTTRRRSASMEAGKLEKKRALARKQADSLRKKLLKNENFAVSSECIDTGAESAASNNSLQACFRPRASSCASSFGRLTSIPQIFEEPSWTLVEHQEPVIQPPVIHPTVIQPTLIQPTVIQPINHEFLSSSDQIFFAPQIASEITSVCLLHPVGACSCNNTLDISDQGASSSNQNNYLIIKDSDISEMLANICTSSVEVPQAEFLEHKQRSDLNYNDYAFVDEVVNHATEVCVLPRNNSMLDDINEVIKKDQTIEIEKVNDSISTTLFISNNNNNLLNLQ